MAELLRKLAMGAALGGAALVAAQMVSAQQTQQYLTLEQLSRKVPALTQRDVDTLMLACWASPPPHGHLGSWSGRAGGINTWVQDSKLQSSCTKDSVCRIDGPYPVMIPCTSQ